MKAKEFIHAGNLKPFGDSQSGTEICPFTKFTFNLPWPIHGCEGKFLCLETCEFSGTLDNQLYNQEIVVDFFYGKNIVQVPPLALSSGLPKLVGELNKLLEGQDVTFSNLQDQVTINLGRQINSVKLSSGLATILGLPAYCCKTGQNVGTADLQGIYGTMLLLCSQVKASTMVQINSLPVIGILKAHKNGFGKSKIALDLSLGMLELNVHQLSSLNLELVSSAAPNLGIPFNGSGYALFSLGLKK